MSDTGTIIVNASPAQEQWAAAIRQVLLVLAGAAATLGYDGLAGRLSGFLDVAAPLAGLIVFALGQIKTRQSAQTKAALANALPDSVASVK